MSEHDAQRSDNSEDLKLLSSNTNVKKPGMPYQSRWIAHWMQTCSSSCEQACKHDVVSNASNIEDHKREHGYLQVESMKSKEAKMLSIDMSTKNTFRCITMPISDPGELNLTSDVLQSAKSVEAEKGKFKIISNTVVGKNVSLSDSKAVLPSKLSVQKLPDSSVNRKKFTTYHFMNSENVSTEWEHFPMFDINRKIDSILAPKKKFGYGTMAVRMSESHLSPSDPTLAPHVVEFASEEHQFEARSISKSVDQRMRPREPIKGLLSYRDDFTGSSHSAVHRFKCDGPNRRSGMCSKEELCPFSSALVYKKQFASTNLTHLNHELCNCSSRATYMVSEKRNDNEMIARSFGSSWSRLKNGSTQVLRDSCPGDIPLPLLNREHGKEIQHVSGSELLPIHKSIHASSSEHVYVSHEMPKCTIHDAKAPRVCTTLNSLDDTKVESRKFSSATQYLLITKKMGTDLSQGDQMIRESTISAKVKGTAFFEMHTLPTMSHCHGQHVANLQCPVSSTNSEDREGVCMDTHFMETQNGSDKNDTLLINVSQIPSSLGLTSSNLLKDVVCPILTKSKSATALPIQQAFSKNATCANNIELSTSGTESMDVDHMFSHCEKLDNNSSPLLESASSPEPSNRWIKRLRHNPLDSLPRAMDSLPCSSKRFKMGDAPYRGEVQNLFSRILDHSKFSSDFSKYHEEQEFNKTPLLTKNGECSSQEQLKSMDYWIQRWCRHSRQTAANPRLAAPVPCGPKQMKWDDGIQPPAPFPKLATPVSCGPKKLRWDDGIQPPALFPKLATPVLCEPEKSKVKHGNLEGKQCPSITAMALMGKAVNNFRPCEFRRKGGAVVWNTE